VNGVLGEGGAFTGGNGGLVLLPNGALLATTGLLPALAGAPAGPSPPAWHLLQAHAKSWCPLAPLAVRGAQGAVGAPISLVVALAGRL
jgi:hypothetical protein